MAAWAFAGQEAVLGRAPGAGQRGWNTEEIQLLLTHLPPTPAPTTALRPKAQHRLWGLRLLPG